MQPGRARVVTSGGVAAAGRARSRLTAAWWSGDRDRPAAATMYKVPAGRAVSRGAPTGTNTLHGLASVLWILPDVHSVSGLDTLAVPVRPRIH